MKILSAGELLHFTDNQQEFYLHKKEVKRIFILKTGTIKLETASSSRDLFIRHRDVEVPLTETVQQLADEIAAMLPTQTVLTDAIFRKLENLDDRLVLIMMVLANIGTLAESTDKRILFQQPYLVDESGKINTIYKGYSLFPGTSPQAFSWAISRTTINDEVGFVTEWAGGNRQFIFNWNQRGELLYS
jgi:hypothetical protein